MKLIMACLPSWILDFAALTVLGVGTQWEGGSNQL